MKVRKNRRPQKRVEKKRFSRNNPLHHPNLIREKIFVESPIFGDITSFVTPNKENLVKVFSDRKPSKKHITLIAEKIIKEQMVGSDGSFKILFKNKNVESQTASGVWPPFMAKVERERGEIKDVKLVKGKLWK